MNRVTIALWALSLAIIGASSATAATVITGAQIRDNTVTGGDIRDRTISVLDISLPAFRALRGQRGPAGAPALTTIRTVQTRGTVQPGSTTQLLPACPAGMTATGGGGSYPTTANAAASSNYPNAGDAGGNATAWVYTVHNYEPFPVGIAAYVICAL